MNQALKRLLRGVVLAGLAVLVCVDSAAQAQPMPEPPPYEVVDWRTVHAECEKLGTSRALTERQIECVKSVVARMPKFDPAKRELFGRYYDPQKYLAARLEETWGNAAGTWRTLQRIPAPEYWPYPEAKRPNLPPPNLDKHYRSGIGAEEYFKALCTHEAGEFINRVVEGVEGVYQIRPRPNASDDALQDPYVLEDPYGYTPGEGRGEPVYDFARKGGYNFVEAPSVAYAGAWAKRWSGYEYSRSVEEPKKSYSQFNVPNFEKLGFSRLELDKPDSQYGYTWRETTGPRERELGIAGGELIVVDLRTGEVLGYRRGFARSPVANRLLGGRNWRSTENCPIYATKYGSTSKDEDMASLFVAKVLKPAVQKGN